MCCEEEKDLFIGLEVWYVVYFEGFIGRLYVVECVYDECICGNEVFDEVFDFDCVVCFWFVWDW